MTQIAFDIDCPTSDPKDQGSVKVSTAELRGYWEGRPSSRLNLSWTPSGTAN
jgi:hypothetical protein